MKRIYMQIRRLYWRRGPIERIRLHQRWFGTPFADVEPLVPREGLVLDLGSGFGLFSAVLGLTAPGRQVLGVDVDAPKVQQARAVFGSLPNVGFKCADLSGYSLPACDGVVMYDVLHHLPRGLAEGMLALAFERLRPGGTLVLKENDIVPIPKRAFSEVWELVATASGWTFSGPVHFRSVEDWRLLLLANGFDVIRAEHMPTSFGYCGLFPHSIFIGKKPA